MRATQEIIYAVTGQTLEYRVIQGRPTSATFEVFADYADDTTTAEFSGTATVDTVNATLTATAGISETDPQNISITSTGIILGRRYLLSEDSVKEWVDPIEIGTGFIRSRWPLRSDYTVAATLASTVLTATVDATWVARLDRLRNLENPNPDYRVKWTILVGGVYVVAYSFFNLVRAQVVHQVDIADIDDRAPGLMDSMPAEYASEQGRPLIDAAWKSVKAKLASIDLQVSEFRDDAILDEMVILRALAMLARGGWHPQQYQLSEYVADTQSEYDRFVETHLQVTLKHRMATGTGSGSDVVYAKPYWGK